ncbi:MAG: HEAT repeat domain-containing protein [Nitrosomonadales bacterium]|nr:HEAT repeat domain-containing protein [Nitrosomonadales bacterium]
MVSPPMGVAGRDFHFPGGEQIVESFIEMMVNNDDGRLRSTIIKAIGTIKACRAESALIQCLNDPDPDIRSDAARVLGNLGCADAVSPLVAALRDTEPDVIISALGALSIIGDSRAVEAIAEAMDSKTSFQYQMGELAGDFAWDIREKAAEVLGRIASPAAIAVLSEMLKDDDADMMYGGLFRALICTGNPNALETVASYLKDADVQTRRKAAKAVAISRLPQAAEFLKQALLDEDNIVRIHALEGVGSLKGAADIVTLTLMLHCPDAQVRAKTAETLFKVGGKAVLKHIVPLLDDASAQVRGKAVEIIGSSASLEYSDKLVEALDDSDESVRGEAVISLGKTGDSKAMDSLVAQLRNKNKTRAFKDGIVIALGKMSLPGALDALWDVLNDAEADANTRRLAAQSMRYFECGQVAGKVRAGISSEDEYTRQSIAKVLRLHKCQESVDLLLSQLRDQSDAVKQEASISLAMHGRDEGLEVLRSMIAANNMENIGEICNGLAIINNHSSMTLLKRCLKHGDAAFRRASVKALGRKICGAECQAVMELFKDEDGEVRREAVIALGNIGDGKALPDLFGLLFDMEGHGQYLRKDIVEALGKISPAKAVDSLLLALEDEKMRNHHWLAVESIADIHRQMESSQA